MNPNIIQVCVRVEAKLFGFQILEFCRKVLLINLDDALIKLVHYLDTTATRIAVNRNSAIGIIHVNG